MKEQKENLIKLAPKNNSDIYYVKVEDKKYFSLKCLLISITLFSFCIFMTFFFLNNSCFTFFSQRTNKYFSLPPSEVKKILSSSSIFKEKDELTFIQKTLRKQSFLQILYDSKKDGDSIETFKQKTSVKQKLLIVINTEKGNRFGGYTSLNFNPALLEQNILKHKITFLFNLDKKKHFNVRTSKIKEEINNNKQYTLSLGDKDLIIYDKFLEKGGYSKPSDYFGEYSISLSNELTNDEEYFKIRNLEVYNVIFPFDLSYLPFEIKGALFDLDGTLIDTEPAYEWGFQEVINRYGNGKKYDWDVKEKVIGGKEEVSARIVKDAYNIKLEISELIKKRNEFAEEFFRKSHPCKGAEKITYSLKDEYGVKLGIATSSNQYLYDIKSENHKGWFKNFDVKMLGDDKRLKKGKPNPDIFLLGMKDLGIEPKNCIIFEDAINGVKAALASGAKIVVAVPMPHFRKFIEELDYDITNQQLIILDSLDDFDFSLIKKIK